MNDYRGTGATSEQDRIDAGVQPDPSEHVNRQHVTDGSGCWCNPRVEHVAPSNETAVKGESFYLNNDPVLINISGVEDEPLWIDPLEVAAIGVRGKHETLVVLKGSGTQLVTKSMHPNEVAQMVAGLYGAGDEKKEDLGWVG